MNRTILTVTGVLSASSLLVVDSAIKGTVLLALAAVAALILRRDSAATRHLVWLLAIVAMLVVPVLSAMLPQWRVLPAWMSSSRPVVADISPLSISKSPGGVIESPERAAPVEVERPSATVFQPATALPDSQPALATPEAVPAPAVRSWNWIHALPLVWAIGFAVLMLRLSAARWMLWNSERLATVVGVSRRGVGFQPANARETTSGRLEAYPTANDPIVMAMETICSQLGIGRPVTLLIHPDKTIPVVWGILRCRLMLPAAARQWSDEQLQSVLLHELAHVKRRDTIVQLLAQVACALHWFNPLVWFAAWRLDVERERSCDDLVLASGIRPSAYAGHLLDVVTGLSPARWTQACGLAMARKSSLEGRLTAVLGKDLNRRDVSVALAGLALAIAVGIAVPIAMLRAADEVPTPNLTGKLAPETIAKLKWGEPVNGLRMALAYPPALGDALLGKKPHFELVVQNVSENEIHFLASDEAPNPRRMLIREGERIVLGLSDPEVSAADWKLQPGQCGVLRLYTKEEQDQAGTIPSSGIESDLSKLGRYHAIVQMEIAKAPAGAWTGELVTGPTRGSADVAAAPAPMHKDARTLYEVWQRYARTNGDIPGALLGELAAAVKQFIKYNPTWETVPKLNEVLPRLDATHDWKPADAIALLDEVAGIQNTLLEQAPWKGTRDTIRQGDTLPKKYADATWGEEQQNGLRAAWVLEPSAAEHRIGTTLKARLLVQNRGQVPVMLQVPTFHQAWVKGTDAKGSEVQVSGISWTTMALLNTVRLGPGAYIEINTPGVGIGPRAGMGPWAGPRVGSNVLAKPGDELTLTHSPVPLDGSEVGMSEDDPHVAGPGWWLAHIKARLNRELPLPTDAAERTRLLDRAVHELFATAPSAEETAAFVVDKTPDALDALAKRLATRVDAVSFSGKLPTAPAKFRVLDADANADKQPRVVLGPGEYPLPSVSAERGNATLKIVGRPVGDRRTNDAQLLFEPVEFTGKLPPDPHQLEVPDGWGTWAIVCRPNDGFFYLLSKGEVRKIDYSNPRKVTDTPANDLPAEFRDEVKRQLDIHEISATQQAEMFEKPAPPATTPAPKIGANEPAKPTAAGTPKLPKLPDDAYAKPGVHCQKFREEDAKRPGGELMGGALEPSKPADREKPLVLGVRTASDAQWRIGGTAKVGLIVRNRTGGIGRNHPGSDVKFSYTGRLDNGLSVVAVDEAGKEHGATIAQFDGELAFQQMLLPVAHVVTIKEFTIRFDAEKRDVSEPRVAAFHLPPGKYKLRCQWSDARPDVAHEGEWTGELVNDELEFTLAAAAPASETPKNPAASDQAPNQQPNSQNTKGGAKLERSMLEGTWAGEKDGVKVDLKFLWLSSHQQVWWRLQTEDAGISARMSIVIEPDGSAAKIVLYKGMQSEATVGRLTLDESGSLRLELIPNPNPNETEYRAVKDLVLRRQPNAEEQKPAGGASLKPATETPPKATEQEPFTAWGKEVNGLQAGLGFKPGEKRPYTHGETATLVVRVRNVGDKDVKFQYYPKFLSENSPTVLDATGKRVSLRGNMLHLVHHDVPKEVNLAVGKEIELYERVLRLAAGNEDAGELKTRDIFLTGKFLIQHEQVIGNSAQASEKLDPTLEKLATGKLELEIKPVAAVQQETPKPESGSILKPDFEQKLKWGEPVNGLRAALVMHPVPDEPDAEDKNDIFLVVQNVTKAEVWLHASDAAPNPRQLIWRDKGVLETINEVAKPIPADFRLQPGEVTYFCMTHPPGKRNPGGRSTGSLIEESIRKDPTFSLEGSMEISTAPDGAWSGKLVSGRTEGGTAIPEVPAEAATVRLEMKGKDADGKTVVMMSFEELQRDEATSTIRVTSAVGGGGSVSGPMSLVHGFCEIAKARGAAYFANLKEWDGEDGTRMYLIGFSKNQDIRPLTNERQPQIFAVGQFEFLFQDPAAADADKPPAKPPGANMVKVPDDQYVKSGFPQDELVGEGVMWNDEQNGLSLGYRITGDEWRILGKEVKVELWVQNPGDKDVKFQLNMRPDIGLRVKLKDAKGEDHNSDIWPNDTPPLAEHRLLPPGHALKVKEFTVSLFWPENDFTYAKGHFFGIALGTYKFHCELELPGFSATGEGGKQLTPAEGEWTGKLTTRELKITVVAPDAPAPRIEHADVNLEKDGTLHLNRKKVTLDELKALAAKDAKKRFTIRADKDVPYAKVIEVVDALKAAGVTEFSFSEACVGDGKYRVANRTGTYEFDDKHGFSICRPSERPQWFTVSWPAEGDRPACALRTFPNVSDKTDGKWAVVWEPRTDVLWWVDDSEVGRMTLTDPARVIVDREGRTNNFSRDFGLPEEVKTEFRRLGFVIGRDKTPGVGKVAGNNTGGNSGEQTIVSAEFGWWCIEGTVTDADGKPLANVPVRVSTNQEVMTEKTDAKGAYRVNFSLPLQLLAHSRAVTVKPMLEGFTERDMAKTGEFNVLLRAGEQPQRVRLADDKDFQPGPIPRFAERDLLPSQHGAFPGKPGRADFVMLKASEITGEIVPADRSGKAPVKVEAVAPSEGGAALKPDANAAVPVDDVAAQKLRKSTPYDFRDSDQYRSLDETSRARLKTVVDDLAQLERALDSFMKDHDGTLPETLEQLVPKYIVSLPEDPFASPDEKIPDDLKHHQRSLDGRGYLYLQKPGGGTITSYNPLTLKPSPGAWQIQSVGLRTFPLRYEKSNPGLIHTRGYWGRLQLDVF